MTSQKNALDSYVKRCRLAAVDTVNKFLRFSIVSFVTGLQSFLGCLECYYVVVASLPSPVTHNGRLSNFIRAREHRNVRSREVDRAVREFRGRSQGQSGSNVVAIDLRRVFFHDQNSVPRV